MQKLEERNTYTPTDIPHIRSNCGLPLNRTETSVHAVSTYGDAIRVCDVNWRNGLEETLCVAGLKTFSNNSDAALTGSGESSRAKPAGTCYKNHLNLLNNRIRRQGGYPATTNARGTLPPCPKEQGIRYP